MGQLLCKQCTADAPTELLDPNSPPDQDTLRFLGQVQLFRRLPQELHPVLATCSQKVEFSPGQVVIRQGDEGDEFFVIRSGEATVDVNGEKVATLKAGDYFGENALLRDEPRTATIIAASQIAAIKITRAQFQHLGLNEKLEFPQRKAVGGGGGGKGGLEVKAPSPKTAAERTLMAEALKQNTNLQTFVTLDDKRINSMIDVAWKEDVAAGTDLITEGDLNADYFYIVQEGSFDIFISRQEGQSAEQVQASAHHKGTVSKGGSFGELALIYFAPRAATVKAKVASTVWVIDRQNFKGILAKTADEIASEYVKHLDKVEVLAPLKDDEKLHIAKALSEMLFTKGETIFQQGEKGDNFYVLVEGEVVVVKDGKEEAKLTSTRDKVCFFGERALLTNEPRAATVKVTSEMAKTLTLDRESFDMLLGPLEELKRRGKEGPSRVTGRPEALVAAPPTGKRFGNILRKDLKRIGLLGCGGFGAVELVEHVPTTDTYALKALSKGYVVKSGMQQSVISEKNVQLMCDSPFIVKLYETYNGSQSLYLLLELALGGELYATYNKKGFHGREGHAKFYVAGVVFAFEHLHKKKIIFRDLKPENLLLNEKGHIKLTDMGLAKVVVGKTYTTCGTPDYFAPELIASTGHTNAVDWWTLGILTFELMGGHPPFESAYPMQIYQKVAKGINKATFPAKCKGAVEDLIKSLCKKEPSERLPMKKGGTSNIKRHTWFRGFDWEAMENLTLEPPYKPQVKSKKDAANFSARKEDMPPQVPYKEDGSGWDKDFATST